MHSFSYFLPGKYEGSIFKSISVLFCIFCLLFLFFFFTSYILAALHECLNLSACTAHPTDYFCYVVCLLYSVMSFMDFKRMPFLEVF